YEAIPGMEHEAAEYENRNPGSVAQSDKAIAGEEFPDLVEITQSLIGTPARAYHTRALDRIEHRVARRLVEQDATADQGARTRHLEQGVGNQKRDGYQRQQQQRRHVAACDHTVIDLHHVDGRYKCQNVDE